MSNVEQQYLKPFYWVQKLNYYFYIAILGTLWLCTNEWIVLMLNSNTWNRFTLGEPVINIK